MKNVGCSEKAIQNWDHLGIKTISASPTGGLTCEVLLYTQQFWSTSFAFSYTILQNFEYTREIPIDFCVIGWCMEVLHFTFTKHLAWEACDTLLCYVWLPRQKAVDHAWSAYKFKCTCSQVVQFYTLTNSLAEIMSNYVRGKVTLENWGGDCTGLQSIFRVKKKVHISSQQRGLRPWFSG